MTPAEYHARELEASVENRVTAWLKARGWEVHPLVAEMPRGYRGRSRLNPPGTPDLVAIRPYRTPFYLELKRAKGGRHSKVQKAEAARLDKKGFFVFIHASNGVDVIEQLDLFMGACCGL